MSRLNQSAADPHDEPPPFLGSWRNVYAAVAAYLAALIVLFYFFRRVFES